MIALYLLLIGLSQQAEMSCGPPNYLCKPTKFGVIPYSCTCSIKFCSNSSLEGIYFCEAKELMVHKVCCIIRTCIFVVHLD